MAERSKTYCPLPFIHSHASVNGMWKPCCNSTWALPIRDSYFMNKFSTHQKWFDGKIMEQLRSDLLSGVKNSMCDVCWNQEDISGKSIRKRYIKKMGHLADIDKPKIKYLDLKLSNKCNLACRMCDYTNSNQILKDVSAIEEQNLHLPRHWERSPTVEKNMDSKGITRAPKHIIDDVKSMLPDLQVLKLTGGEPTVIPEVLELFDICIKEGYAKNLQLNITTNGTKFNSRFLEKIKKFKDVYLNISCDGYGKVYDYVRYPFKWDKFAERINDIKKSGVGASITAVPQMYNIENVDQLQKWGNRVGIEISLNNNILQPQTNYNSLKYMPVHILKWARKQIKRSNDSYQLIRTLDSLCSKTYQPTEAEEAEIVKSVQSIDTVRNQDFRDYLEPMTAEWLEGLFKKYA